MSLNISKYSTEDGMTVIVQFKDINKSYEAAVVLKTMVLVRRDGESNSYTASSGFHVKIKYSLDGETSKVVANKELCSNKNLWCSALFGTPENNSRFLATSDEISARIKRNESSIRTAVENAIAEDLRYNASQDALNFLMNFKQSKKSIEFISFEKNIQELIDNIKFNETRELFNSIVENNYNIESFEKNTRNSVLGLSGIYLPSCEAKDEASNTIITMYEYALDNKTLKLTVIKKLDVELPSNIISLINNCGWDEVGDTNNFKFSNGQMSLF